MGVIGGVRQTVAPRPKGDGGAGRKRPFRNVEVTGAARLYRAASVWTVRLGCFFTGVAAGIELPLLPKINSRIQELVAFFSSPSDRRIFKQQVVLLIGT